MNTIRRDELSLLYGSNEDFKEYVDKYSRQFNISVYEALRHAIVWEKAKDIVERLNN